MLIVVNAYSKGPEVFKIKNITAHETIQQLESLFLRYGSPQTIVSDNGATFTSAEFQQFLRNFGIRHITTAPFHPSSNGQAERFVGTFMNAIRSMHEGSLQEKIDRFLLSYRRVTHTTTGETPAKLFLGREIRTKLDLLRPNLQENVEKKTRKNQLWFKEPNYSVGETVAVRCYNQSPNKKWQFGTIIEKDGSFNYTVSSEGRILRRHVEQIRRVGEAARPNFHKQIPLQVKIPPRKDTENPAALPPPDPAKTPDQNPQPAVKASRA